MAKWHQRAHRAEYRVRRGVKATGRRVRKLLKGAKRVRRTTIAPGIKRCGNRPARRGPQAALVVRRAA